MPHLLSADGLKKINSDLLQILIKQICELDAPGKKEKEFESLIPQNRFNSNSDVRVIQRVTFKCPQGKKVPFPLVPTEYRISLLRTIDDNSGWTDSPLTAEVNKCPRQFCAHARALSQLQERTHTHAGAWHTPSCKEANS